MSLHVASLVHPVRLTPPQCRVATDTLSAGFSFTGALVSYRWKVKTVGNLEKNGLTAFPVEAKACKPGLSGEADTSTMPARPDTTGCPQPPPEVTAALHLYGQSFLVLWLPAHTICRPSCCGSPQCGPSQFHLARHGRSNLVMLGRGGWWPAFQQEPALLQVTSPITSTPRACSVPTPSCWIGDSDRYFSAPPPGHPNRSL